MFSRTWWGQRFLEALERFTDAVDAFPQEVVRAARTLWAGPRRVGRAVKRIMSLAAAGSSGRVRGFPRLSRRPPSE